MIGRQTSLKISTSVHIRDRTIDGAKMLEKHLNGGFLKIFAKKTQF